MKPLADATAAQSTRFARAFALIEQAIAARAFPGASLAITYCGSLVALQDFGRFTFEPRADRVERETRWDLASLTKPIATASIAMRLVDAGMLRLEAPAATYLPEFASAGQRGWREAVTVRMLLNHRAGLPAHRKLYLEHTGRDAMLAAARAVPLEAEPGNRTEYSDIGYIILGELLERLAGQSLEKYLREIFAPLKLYFSFLQFPGERLRIPPAAFDTEWRRRLIQGEVQDENACAMGGITGHAGLFGDSLSVARFAECILRGGEGLFRPETVREFTTRGPLDGPRTPGWDTPSAPSQSGTLLFPRAFGHLGYTGTSLWCDPERNLSITLLTNRTWPDTQNQAIREVRPAVHDAIVSALEHERPPRAESPQSV